MTIYIPVRHSDISGLEEAYFIPDNVRVCPGLCGINGILFCQVNLHQ